MQSPLDAERLNMKVQSDIYDGPRTRPAHGSSLLLRALEVWLVISVVEVIHGVARVVFLEPIVGDFTARQLAVFSGSLLIIAVTFLFRRWLGIASPREALAVGGAWLVLTIGFELVLGRIVLDLSWNRLLSDYDLSRGGLMPLGLLILFFTPLLVFRLRTN